MEDRRWASWRAPSPSPTNGSGAPTASWPSRGGASSLRSPSPRRGAATSSAHRRGSRSTCSSTLSRSFSASRSSPWPSTPTAGTDSSTSRAACHRRATSAWASPCSYWCAFRSWEASRGHTSPPPPRPRTAPTRPKTGRPTRRRRRSPKSPRSASLGSSCTSCPERRCSGAPCSRSTRDCSCTRRGDTQSLSVRRPTGRGWDRSWEWRSWSRSGTSSWRRRRTERSRQGGRTPRGLKFVEL
mmetsp:Transcript_50975/g.94444  ORF Transcript_50975/g.94444 Transcript_50975/m.94444 type:complete len:241 (-) Transcript_50975:210-932(-)